MYALKTIKENGLVGHAILDVKRATLVPQLRYASPAWLGFLKVSGFFEVHPSECSRLQAIIDMAVRYGFLPTHSPSASDLFQSSAILTTFFIKDDQGGDQEG